MKINSLSELGEYGIDSVLQHPATPYSATYQRVRDAIGWHRAGFSRMLDFAGVLVDPESARELLQAGKLVVALGGEVKSFAAVQAIGVRESAVLPTEAERSSLAERVTVPAWAPERPGAMYLGSVSCGSPDYVNGVRSEPGYQLVYERFGTADRPLQREHFPGIDVSLPVVQVERPEMATA